MATKKPESFTERENRAMRFLLRGMMDKEGWSQAKAGAQLGIVQQAVGTIINKNGGFSRPTAKRLAELNGFATPEDMLADLGALDDAKPIATSSAWLERDLAEGHARRLKLDAKAIGRVNARYTEFSHSKRPAKWWVERYLAEDRELEDERRAVPAAPPSTPAVEVTPKRKKRSA